VVVKVSPPNLPNYNVIECSKVVASEGKSDLYVLEALAKSIGIEDIEFRELGGKSSLTTKLESLRKSSGFDKVVSLLVVRDADLDACSAWVSIRGALSSAGFPAPHRVCEFVNGAPKVAALILPPDSSQGELEDWLLMSIAKQSVMTCVNQFFNCLDSVSVAQPRQLAKAKANVFIASKPEPHVSVGVAAQKGYWHLEHECFSEVKRLLREM